MTIELKMSPFYDVITLEELSFLLIPPPIIGVLVNAAVSSVPPSDSAEMETVVPL